MFQILLDNREKDLHYHLTHLIQTIPLYKDIKIECKPLPLGDVILQQHFISLENQKEQEEEEEVNKQEEIKDIIIFERKTVKDLQSSIYDGRYREQSSR